jgi:phage N-6-adenine-methyltransferase
MSVDLRQEWETPPDFWEVINAEFHFEMDACAIPKNTKCVLFVTPEQDGLTVTWAERTWCNPGFSNIGAWLRKAIEQVARKEPADRLGTHIVVMGLVNPSTDAWSQWGLRASEIRLLSPRVQFVAPFGVKQTSNPRENALFIFRYNPHRRPADIWTWKWK